MITPKFLVQNCKRVNGRLTQLYSKTGGEFATSKNNGKQNELIITFSPWKSNVRVCMPEVPLRSSLKLNPL
jgi:hypothetical protein